MRGYFEIMSSSESSTVELNGNGQKVDLPHTLRHTLWQPKTSGAATPEPMWHLRVAVLKDEEGMGDCPNKRFVGGIFIHYDFG
jgi:hypothetical protein